MESECIGKIYGEEPPHISRLCISKILNIDLESISFKSTENPNEFIIDLVGNKYYIYILSKPSSNRTRADIYIDAEKKILIEFTACCLSSSGNNAQFQRFTKFIPFINNPELDLVYYIYNKDDRKNNLRLLDKLVFKMWKTIGIKVCFEKESLQNDFDNLEIFTTLHEFKNEWKNKAKIYHSNDCCIMEDFNVIKNDKVNNDPGIGKILLTIMTLVKLGEKKILLKNTGIMSFEQFSLKNKLFRSINHIKLKYNVDLKLDFEILNEKISDCIRYDTGKCFGGPIDSESIVSINYELKLEDKVNYTNHASCEQSRLCYKSNITNIPKKVLKADLIYSKENNTYLVEAEKYCNLKNGQLQINSWCRDILTNRYYKNIFKEQNILCYLILYDFKNQYINFEDSNFKNVRFILQNNGQWLENPNFQFLKFN